MTTSERAAPQAEMPLGAEGAGHYDPRLTKNEVEELAKSLIEKRIKDLNIDDRLEEATHIRKLSWLERKLIGGARVFWAGTFSLLALTALLMVSFLYLTDAGYVKGYPIDIGFVDQSSPLSQPEVRDGTPLSEVGQRASIQDILLIVVPVFLAAGALILGLTGLRRLQLYDEQFKDFRVELRENRKSDLEWQRDTLESRVKDVKSSVKTLVEQAINNERREIEQYAENAQMQAASSLEELKEFRARNEWLLDQERRETLLRSHGSIGEAHKAVTELFSQKKSSEGVAVVERALAMDLRGTAVDYFNLGSELGRNDLEDLAYQVSEAGVRYYPQNSDLLANVIQFATNSGRRDRAREIFEEFIKPLSENTPQLISWRLTVFTGSYLETYGEPEQVRSWYEQLIDYWKSKHARGEPIPRDAARGFSKYAMWLHNTGGDSGLARDIGLVGREIFPTSAQIEQSLALIFMETGDEEREMEAINRALANDTDTQSEVNSSRLLWRRGAIKDQHLFRIYGAVAPGEPAPAQRLAQLGREALVDYVRAIQAPDADPTTLRQARQRSNAIVATLEVVGVPPEQLQDIVPHFLVEHGIVKLSRSAGGDDNSSASVSAQKAALMLKEIVPFLEQLPEEQVAAVLPQLASKIKSDFGRDEWPALAAVLKQVADDQEDDSLGARLMRLAGLLEA